MHNAWIRPSLRDVPRRILFSPLAVLRFKAYAWSTIPAARSVIALEPLTGVYDEADFERRRFEKFLRLVSESTARCPGKAVLSAAGDGVNVLPCSRTYISEPAGYHLPLNIPTSTLNVYSCSPSDRVGIYTTSEF